MLMAIEQVLEAAELARFREVLAQALFGRTARARQAASPATSSAMSSAAGRAPRALGAEILSGSPAIPFISAALPRKICPPRSSTAMPDGAPMAPCRQCRDGPAGWPGQPAQRHPATLFLADPTEYDGGELEIESPFGVQSVRSWRQATWCCIRPAACTGESRHPRRLRGLVLLDRKPGRRRR